jgi:hypothetical protein
LINVFYFGYEAVFGPATHVFDDWEGRADAASNGSNSFPEAVRCPLKAGGADVLIVRKARESQAEMVDAAP